MANKKLAVRITGLRLERNGRSGRADVTNRFVFQLLHPVTQDKNPAASFGVGSGVGLVPEAQLDAALADGIVFKGQSFDQAFHERVRIRIHHFQDVHRDWFQVLLGKLFGLVLKDLLGKINLVVVTLDRLIDPVQSLKLSEDTYAQKLGFFELIVDPDEVKAGGATPASVALVAPEEVVGFDGLGPSGPPKRITIVKKGQKTASIDLEINLS
ncbi:MAG: hypothetical protein ACHQQS_09485 [Thermoanaerobaculales bacterium]